MARTGQQRLFNVPVELSSFIGRREELAEVRSLVGKNRLVTLVGTGGVGKTRLALRAAIIMQRVFPDGIWLVELARVTDPALVEQEVGAALGLGDRAFPLAAGTIVKHIDRKHMLLVLDNCEHVLNASAILVSELLKACPYLSILTTSRQPLGVTGETSWRVPSLSLPPSGDEVKPLDMTRFEAVRLFAERAASLQQDFAITEANAQTVVEVCRRLDGIPLAIELAAVRLRELSVGQILARLDDRLGLLTSGGRTDDVRHQTLRAALDWTYDLLSFDERLLWQRLSVFGGGFQLEEAESVCADQVLPTEAVLGLVASLVEKSVVSPEHRDAQVRYRLLETIREYGNEKLMASGDESLMRRRHTDYYALMAEEAERDYGGGRQLEAFDRLSVEHANLRAALQFRVSNASEAELGVSMAAHLWLYWEARSRVTEGREWLRALLAIAVAPSLARARGSGPLGTSLCFTAMFPRRRACSRRVDRLPSVSVMPGRSPTRFNFRVSPPCIRVTRSGL